MGHVQPEHDTIECAGNTNRDGQNRMVRGLIVFPKMEFRKCPRSAVSFIFVKPGGQRQGKQKKNEEKTK